MMRTDHTISPVLEARSAGEGFVQTRAFEVLSRTGFVARGVVYGIIGLLALDLAARSGRQDHEPAGRPAAPAHKWKNRHGADMTSSWSGDRGRVSSAEERRGPN